MNIPGIDSFYIFISQLPQLRIPAVRWTDVVEVLIIAYLAYHILLWIKNTRAWQLMKGISVVLAIAFAAAFFNMTTILWIFQHFAGIAVTALVIILQPELRNAMEELGRRNFLSSIFRMEPSKTEEGRFSDRTINELVRACTEMGRVKTGALIVIEQTTPLVEYARSGIDIDGIVSSQLLINIFEKNTPLHDGAVIIKGNRIVSATSYLPLSSSRLDKNLGTRHRAGMGISEETDALTLIVSEETGFISYTYKGQLWNKVTPEELRGALIRLQNKLSEESSYEVNTPNSTMSVRGTMFRVEVYMENGIKYTKVSVFEGGVASYLVYKDGSTSDREVKIEKGKEVLIYEDDKTVDYVSEPKDIDYSQLPESVLKLLEDAINEGRDLDLTIDELEKYLSSVVTVTFKYNGKTFGSQTIKRGDKATKPSLAPASSGKWDWDFSKPVNKDIVIEWK